jgi:hypothetical protein
MSKTEEKYEEQADGLFYKAKTAEGLDFKSVRESSAKLIS